MFKIDKPKATEPRKLEPWENDLFKYPEWYTDPDQTITIRVVQVRPRAARKAGEIFRHLPHSLGRMIPSASGMMVTM